MQNRKTKSIPRSFNEVDIDITDKATRRIIAPYVKIVRKGGKSLEKDPEKKETKKFNFHALTKPTYLLQDLATFLSDKFDLILLLQETTEVLKNTIRATSATLYMVDHATDELYDAKKKILGEKLKRWKIKTGTTIAAYAAIKKECLLIDDITSDERFPQGTGQRNSNAKSVLAVCVASPDGDCYAIIELCRDDKCTPFVKEHLKIAIVIAGWVGAGIYQNDLREALEKQHELSDYLLDLIKCYFAGSVQIEVIISNIVTFAKTTLDAERGTFFIIDKDYEDLLLAQVFEEGINDNGEISMQKKNAKVSLATSKSIAGLVARTGATVNIRDAANDPRFFIDGVENNGFTTKSVLCMPIVSVDTMLGVVQVINKKNGPCFTPSDENLFKTFSVYCALALNYTRLHLKMVTEEKTNESNLKLLKTQLKPCSHEMEHFVTKPTVTLPYDFNEFQWYITPEEHPSMPQLVLYMVMELIPREDIIQKNLMEFILSVRKCYRNNPYHNFEHAFNVMHCMYNILKRNRQLFSEIELKSLLIAALCHDVDHGGFTNNFLQLTSDTLAQLYDESILEHYHYRVAMTILSAMPIFSLSVQEYEVIAKEMREAILATDLASYFKFRIKLLQLVNDKQLTTTNARHRTLVKAIMMTSSDLSGNCKPFLVAKTICENILREFYHQGDLEKQMGVSPLPLMDREKSQMVPEDQIQFLSVIVLPCLELIVKILPNTVDLHTEATLLKKTWQEILNLKGKDFKIFN